MSGEDRTEWPTRQFVEDLREQGVVWSSPFAVRAAFLAGATGVLIAMGGSFVGAVSEWLKEAASDSSLAASLHGQFKVHAIFGESLVLIFAIFLGLFPAVIAALLQTRFYMGFSGIGFSVSRLFPFGRGWKSARKSPLYFILLSAMIFCFGLISVWLYSSTAAGFLNLSRAQAGARMGDFLHAFGAGLLALAVILFTGGWVLSRMIFLSAHRMTRKEMEAESREEV